MVEAAVSGPVSRSALAPGAPPVLVAGAGDQAVHGRRPRLLHADTAAAAARETAVRQRDYWI